MTELEKKYYTVHVKNLGTKEVYLLETAFGSEAVLSRGKDNVVVNATSQEVERVGKMYDWISGYEVYSVYLRVVNPK